MIKVAHRGTTAKYPENSKIGIIYALNSQADWIEVDLRVTADSEFILFHDYFLKSKLNLFSTISKKKWKMIKNIPLRHRGNVSEEYIPLAFDVIPRIEKKNILIDIKSNISNHDLNSFIVELSNKCDLSRILLATRCLRQFKLIRSLSYSYSYKTALFFSFSMLRFLLFGDENLKCDFLLINWRLCNRLIVKRANKLGIPIILSCIQNVELEDRAKNLEVMGYFINL